MANLTFQRFYDIIFYMKIIKVILITISLLIIVYFFPVIMNERIELTNGTLMSMNRLTKQITVKPSGSNLYYIADPSGSVSYRDYQNKEIGYVPPNFNDNLYKTCLSVLKDY